MRTTTMVLAGVIATLFAGEAPAQDPAAVKMPAWDASFSYGMFSNQVRDEEDGFNDSDYTTGHAEARIDMGRYWTTHLKTELGVSFVPNWTEYDYDTIPVPGLPNGGYVSAQKSLRLTVFTPSVTYQFFENRFMHPYVSTGTRVGLVQTHVTRPAETLTQNRITFAVAAVDRQESRWVVRPFVAGGFKSYFNERTFLRTEAMTAFSGEGLAQFTLRIGFGFDF